MLNKLKFHATFCQFDVLRATEDIRVFSRLYMKFFKISFTTKFLYLFIYKLWLKKNKKIKYTEKYPTIVTSKIIYDYHTIN